MGTSFVVQSLVNGVMLGLTYVLIATGLTLVFSVMNILNFAHGELFMLGSFAIFLFAATLKLPYFISLALAAVVVALLGVTIERVVFRPLRARGSDMTPAMIICIGLIMLFQDSARLLFGPEDKAVPSALTGVIEVGGVTLSSERMLIVVAALVIMAGLYYLIYKTNLGYSMRAVAQDAEAAALQGVSINKVCAICFAISAGLAAIAGGLLAPVFYINPFLGFSVVLKALVVIVIGGLGSLQGALVGGLILGFAESFGYTFIGGYTDTIAFGCVILILLLRPRGLFGERD